MGLSGILSLLKGLGRGAKEGGDFLKDYVSQRYIPNALRTTRTDEGLDFLEQVPSTLRAANKVSALKVMKQQELALKKGQDLIDAVQAGGITRGPAAKRAFDEIEETMKMLESQSKTLIKQADLIDDLDWAQNLMRQEYQKEKVVGSLKSLIPVVGAGMTGLWFGAKQQYENPDFHDPDLLDKLNPFRTQEPEEALEEMEEATQTKSRGTEVGENVANVLMDIISPIPRYTDRNNGRE